MVYLGFALRDVQMHSTERTSVLCGDLSLTDVRRFTVSELYPHPWREEG